MMRLALWRLSRKDCWRLKISDTYSLHREVYNLFERDAGRILYADKGYRQGPGGFERHVLVLSGSEPHFPPAGVLEARTVPESWLGHAAYRFEVVLNPVIRRCGSGRLEPVRGREAVAAWFGRRTAEWGFDAPAEHLVVDSITADIFRKGGNTITLEKARLEGLLVVTDRERFRRGFAQGLGRGRAFGCGLLQLVPLQHFHRA